MGFDALVLGAGSAGSVVAARLAEAGASVCLVEAGDWPRDPDIADPLAWPSLQGRAFDWCHRTVPQPHTAGRAHDWPRGRVVGGSSCLHAMAHVRGHPDDFAAWGEVGGPRWASLARGFARSALPLLHPTHELSDLARDFMAAGQAIGAPSLPHHNAGPLAGTAANTLTIRDGRRVSVADAYLVPARDRLTLLTGATVGHLTFAGRRATGAVLRQEGATRAVEADRVIVCAGAIGSPLLLMRSGIGDPDVLARAGLPCRIALPGVGRNLHDHLLAAGNVYAARRPVPASRLQHSESLMYLHADDPARADGVPDIVLACVLLPAVSECFARPAPGTAYTIMCGVTHPTSRGSLRPSGPGLDDPPLIDPNYLATEHDRRVFRDSLEMARRVGRTGPLADWSAGEILPGPEVRAAADLDAFLARAAVTHHHPVGTCALGAVVDSELRVRGTDGLHVVDASVVPRLTTGPVNAAVVALAEIWAADIWGAGTGGPSPRNAGALA
jgi:choline dehydrogenase-like flavoprotein